MQYTAQTISFQEGNISSLWYFLHQVPDYRDKRGLKYSLATILTLSLLAMCCGYFTYTAIASWIIDYQKILLKETPFLAGFCPNASTIYRIFSSLSTCSFEVVMAAWVKTYVPSHEGDGIALDGKTTAGDTLHLVAAFVHRAKSVLFEKATDTKGKELACASDVLSHLDLEGRTVTGDALYAQKKICEEITRREGGYVIIVKENQETLKNNIALFFTSPPFGTSIERYTTKEKSHGRYEERMMEISRDITSYLSWPGLTHIFRVTRIRVEKEKETSEVAFGIARLLPGKDRAENILSYQRGHWGIENQLHRQRDVVFGEDHSTIRKKHAPHTMAIMRNIVTTVFHQTARESFPATMRHFAAKPHELFTLFQLSKAKRFY